MVSLLAVVVAPVAPVVAPALAGLATAIGMLLMTYLIEWGLGGFLRRTADSTPSPLKGWIRGAVNSIVSRVKKMVRAGVGRSLEWVPDYLRHLTTVVTANPNEVLQLAFELTAMFHRLGDLLFRDGPGVPERLLGAIPRLQRRLDRHLESIENIENVRLPALSGRITDLRSDLFADVSGAGRGWIWRLGDAVGNLTSRLFDPETGAIRVLQRQMEAVQHDANELIRGRILPLEHGYEYITTVLIPGALGELNALRVRIGSIELLQNQSAPYIGAIAATWSIPAFRSFTQVLLQNEPKLRRQCQLDLDEVDDLLSLIPAALSLALILDVTRGGSEIVQVLNPIQRSIVRGGSESFLG